MGGGQSVRATHFQPAEEAPEPEPADVLISISNKMVERLVEDAALAGGAAQAAQAPPPRADYKDKVYMERLKCMDDAHSERTGLTIPDMTSLANRIEYRTANMVSVDPVCAEYKARVIDCYSKNDSPEDFVKCWDSVGEFSACVSAASEARLRARGAREARSAARRSRHMQLARQHELRDLGPPPPPADKPV